ncbi:MAG: hypothetical protein A3B25_03475 [Candidatus Ryanbacteria bacterium RIFCSPLOWO2_01_FULL_48_26]|uniref:Uncharacterized protein n=1 Tax=Candidatus Ryanbacteria bacterium RIFCSPLOWO2_01_FULL_48_26 TaxID=1802126 RepID=A0A1G2GRD4_9BACT|nr:MAG: hypothetical protein A3B25_03475 [Candidatus Ryanbacteria bacterium RIFCSPLOWO2_01_FULL_48_26]
MAKGHRLFHRNSGTLNRHFQVTKAAVPVVRVLLRCFDVKKVNTSPFSQSHGSRLIRIARTDRGLAVETRGDGLCQVIYACTDNPGAVKTVLEKKFHELIKR